MSEPIIIGEFQKNVNEIIRASIRWWKGKPQLDVRVFWRLDPEEDYKPSRKGITLQVDEHEKYDKLVKLLKDAEPQVREAFEQLEEKRDKVGEEGD